MSCNTLAGIIGVGLTYHMSRERFRDNQVRARQMAHGALQLAIAKLKQRQDFRENVVCRNDPSVPEQEASLTFDPDSGAPYSTNNTRSPVWAPGWDGPALWSNGQVPPNSVHLVAVGKRLNAEYIAEAIIYFPPFPYALASSGKVVADGRLEVLGVESLSDLDNISEDEKLGGDIASNSPDSDAIVLNQDAAISGDVRALGGVRLNGAQPDGEVLLGEETDIPAIGVHRPTGTTPESDPTIYVDDYDPDKFSDTLSLTVDRTRVEGEADALEIAGRRVKVVASDRPLELSHGVELDDGVLYVEGDVVIRGGLSGMGAIVATGKITVVGPASVSSDLTALISGNGVRLDGQGLGRSKFQGLVATKGDFRANSATIAGAFVSSGDNPQARLESSLQLEDVRAVYAPEATQMNIVVHVELKNLLNVGEGSRSDSEIGLLAPDGTFYTFTGDPSLSNEERKAQKQRTYRQLQGVQGQVHPLKDGQVVLRKPDGTYETDPSRIPRAVRMTINNMTDDWNEYTRLLEASQVEEYKLFEIDLNRFSSGSSRIKIVTYR